ncbi:CDGSH iron-sulfur domain-containing protein [Crocosphaera sp.]|uniref:CDGSH iron-sulfur domain-containing protein n=1 Tax=Crocosphaera sp. TaxID=2729996 RepID=UPI003F27F53B|nr:CDGSH iron-sulfur domain-containing protein [Crocosphaera sp.]
MNTSELTKLKPIVLELEAGDYFRCTCGQSKNGAFCDGSHKGTEFTPVKFTLEEKQTVALCDCAKTDNSPFCDGSHTKI